MTRFSLLVIICCLAQVLSAPLELPPRIQKFWEQAACLGADYDSNEMGIWFWIPGGTHVGKTLIVIGGDDMKVVAELLQEGYMVWVRREKCRDVRPKLNSQVCREYFGYFGYLSDSDERKPTPETVAFLHGHKQSWHQRYGWKSLTAATECALAKNRFTPIVRLEWEVGPTRYTNYRQYLSTERLPKYILKTSRTNIGYVAFWNKYFSALRPIKSRLIGGWCCGQYVIPRDVIARNPHEFYAQLLELFLTSRGGFAGSFNGYFLEYAFHLFFGEPSTVDPYTQLPCLGDKNPELIFLNHSAVDNYNYSLLLKEST